MTSSLERAREADEAYSHGQFDRLNTLSARIQQLHRERATVSIAFRREYTTRIQTELQGGSSVSAATQLADYYTTEFRFAVEELDGELAALCEERDHLRFVIDHLT